MLSSRSAQALRGLAVAAVTVLVPAVAGCEAGSNAPTQQWHQPTPGASAQLNQIAISNVFVLGATPPASLTPGGSAGLYLALANNGNSGDRLVSISAPGSARAVLLPKGGVTLASGQSVLLQGPAPQVLLEKLTRQLGGGVSIPVVLDFLNAGTVTLQVPVMPRSQYYTTFSPAPVSPSASPSATGTKAKITPMPTPSLSPSGTASPTG
jgi:copper(I)-binding protein